MIKDFRMVNNWVSPGVSKVFWKSKFVCMVIIMYFQYIVFYILSYENFNRKHCEYKLFVFFNQSYKTENFWFLVSIKAWFCQRGRVRENLTF